jgi:diacylglycerol kinase (ATP)
MRVELIYNARAGPRTVRRELHLVIEFLERNGWTITTRETQKPLEATGLARQAAAGGADMVIAAGGDGTVNEVACGLIGSQTAMGVLPIGTTNVWALQMRIPTLVPFGPGQSLERLVGGLEDRTGYTMLTVYHSTLLAAAKVLVEGKTCTVDVGQVEDRYFLLWAGVGLDAAVTAAVSPDDKRAFGPWAFVGTALDVARDYRSAEVKLVLDGNVKRVDASLIVVSNVQFYAGLMALGAQAHIDDGKLDVCVFREEGLVNYVQYILKIALGQHLDDPRIEYYQVEEIAIEAARPLPVHVDDELYTETPVTIRVVPRALRVILPQNVPPSLFVGG